MSDDRALQTKADGLLVTTPPITADELINKISQRGLTRITSASLQRTLGNLVKVPRSKYQVKLSCQQTWIENKGELRLFGADVMHPGENIAMFSNEASTVEKYLLIWLYGLTVTKNYSALLTLQAYPQQLGGPAPNEAGAFHVLANDNDFMVKPTYQEQIIPLSLLAVKSTEAMILVHGIDLRQWRFRQASAKEVDL